MRTLIIDMGNTRIKWSVRENGRWVEQGALPTTHSGELSSLIPTLLPLSRAGATSVAGPQAEQGLEIACRNCGLALHWITVAPEACGVRNLYQPGQLGADRWAALVGARHLAGAHPTVVVNAGTATTIDALDASGDFLGGLILPGLAMMERALRTGTAGLAETPGGMFSPFPRSTADAITTGALQATVGAIERVTVTLRERTGTDPRNVTRLLSGGQARSLAPWLEPAGRTEDLLVLEGIVRLMDEPVSPAVAPGE